MQECSYEMDGDGKMHACKVVNERHYFWTLKFVRLSFFKYCTIQSTQSIMSAISKNVNIICDKIAFSALRSLQRFLLCANLTLQGVTKSLKHGNRHEHTLLKCLLNCIRCKKSL